MKKRLFIIFIFTFVFLFGLHAVRADEKSSTGKYRLVWNNDPTTTVTIVWDQLRGINPVVYYGQQDFARDWTKYPQSQKPTRTVLNYRGMNNNFAELKGLKPDCAYYFIIKDSESISRRFWFRTAPDRPKPFTFICGGDTKSSGTAHEAGILSNKMVAKLRPLFVVFDGDYCSGNGTSAERWQLWLNDWTNFTIAKDGRIFPLLPVHGNHENGEKSVLNKLFNAPYQYGNNENIYYSISFGDKLFHFIALNSQVDPGSDEKEWLKKDLRAHKNFAFTFAAYHKPFIPHTSRKADNTYQYESWAPLFYKYGVDIALEADSHMSKITFPLRPSNEPGSSEGFVRDDKNGTMFIGEGSWGASPRLNDDDKPWTLRSGSFNQIKWIQVFPEMNGNPAHIDIRTVITATKNQEGVLISHIEDIPDLVEGREFIVPENIDLYSPLPYGAVITYPFVTNVTQ